MKKLMVFLLLASGLAQANQVCQNVYDPMNRRWVLVCHEVAQQPVCRNVWDAMNQRWVLVCE